MNLGRLLRQRMARRERGAVTVLVATVLGFGVVTGSAALAVDVGAIYAEREDLQSGADAAAYAVAHACVAGQCTGASATTNMRTRATRYAELNARDGSTEVTEVCGRWDSLQACSAPASNLSRCLGATPPASQRYVEVRVRTRMADGTSLLPPSFAAAMTNGQYRGTAVAACARVNAVITPAQALPALWADSTSDAGTTFGSALVVRGSYINVTELVHSNAGVRVDGSLVTLPSGSEYVTTFGVYGSSVTAPSPQRVSPRTLAGTADVADYRPGGSRSSAGNYRAIAASSCVGGVWSPTSVPAGIVYVPCSVSISASSIIINATLVAEGTIRLWGPSATVTPPAGAPALISASNAANAIDIAGSSARINGSMQALAGGITLPGSYGDFQCGVIGRTIQIEGSYTTVSSGASCGAGTGSVRLWLAG